MGPRWKLLVEGLGKIERAEVEVHPLMLFVGENNSGKSYLATLMWALLAMQGELRPPEGPTLKKCEEWLTRKAAEHPNSEDFALTDEDRALFVKLLNEALSVNQTHLVRRMFNNDEARLSRVEVRSASSPLFIHVNSAPEGLWGVGVRIEDERIEDERWDHHWNIIAPADTALAAMYIAAYVAFGHFTGRFDGKQWPGMPLFLPAARTGFMLFYPSVVSRQIRGLARTVEAEAGRLEVTAPAIPLLELLAIGLKHDVGPYAPEADFLEGPLRGRVELEPGVGINRYYYRPAGSEARLPMALSSSLVTELTPLIMILRHFGDFPVLIVEEPEAFLHPKMQRHLARTVVRLIRKGLYVWITTHSENFCQQINNFLKIGNSPKRAQLQEQLGYESNEYLTLDDVSGYEFTVEGERSKVTEMTKKKSGLVMPTFNRELTRLTKETLLLQRETAADE